MLPCPSSEHLDRLLAEKLSPAERSLVETHVETCAHCQAELQRLVSGTTSPFAKEEVGEAGNFVAGREGMPEANLERLKQAVLVSEAALIRACGAPGPLLPAVDNDLPVIPGYEIECVLGRGGMGVVYRARQVKANRLVALKMVLSGGHADTAELERFRTEAEAIARLQHPNIVQVHEVGEHRGLPFFSLELCQGGSLDRTLAGNPVEAGEAARLVRALAVAMQAAHQASVIHRDLKPANVLLLADGTPKISDFGLARKLDEAGQTQTGAILGTPSYMAPEQAQGNKDIGPAADIYALGAILYECLTGRPPFRAVTALDTIAQVVNEEPVPPQRLNAQVPTDLQTIALKCLHKEPGKRYASAQQLADDLGRFLAGEPIWARPVGWPERAGKWVQRNPVVASLLAAVVVAVAGGCWALWERAAQQATQQAEQAERAVETERSVSLALGKAENLRDQARQMPRVTSQHLKARLGLWRQAEVALGQAEVALNTGTAIAHLHQRVRDVSEEIEQGQRKDTARHAQALRKENLFRNLDEARLTQSTWKGHGYDYADGLTKYAAAFAAVGMECKPGQSAELAGRIRAEDADVRGALLVALDDWRATAMLAGAPGLAGELAKAAVAADDDAWRKKLRAAAAVRDRAALRALSLKARQFSWPATSLNLLAHDLTAVGERDESVALLRWARGRHPTDFWLHLALAHLLRTGKEQTPAIVEETIASFRVALALRPRAAAVLNDLGLVLEGKDEWDEAIVCFRRAIDIDPKHSIALSNLGNALVHEKKEDEGIACYKKAIDIEPRNAGYQFNLGLALKGKGRLDEAVACLKKATRLGPGNGTFHLCLGDLLARQGKRGEAVAAYRQGVKFRPTDATAHYDLAIALNDDKKPDEAVAAYRQAIKLKPDYVNAHYNLGLALVRQKKLDEAVTAFRRVITLKPADYEAYHNLGLALQEQKKPDEAVAAFRQAIKLRPDDFEAQYNLGHALRQQKKLDETVTAFRRASKLKPGHYEVHYNLGRALHEQGKVDEALAAYRQAIKLKPGLAEAHNCLGVALAQQHKVAEAMASFREAIKFKPKDPDAYQNLGNALRTQKKLEEASAAYRQCIKLNPRNGPAHLDLGLTLLVLGHFKESLAALKTSQGLLPEGPGRQKARQLIQWCERFLALEARLPAVLKGTDKPANAGEQIEFAHLCYRKKFNAAAAQFYRDGFAAEPRIADDVPSGHRYSAACCAALTGCGKDEREHKLPEKQRVEWRRQAQDWLRADLKWWAKVAGRDDAQSKAAIAETMRRWQTDDDLAGVRAQAALKSLPDAERQQWNKLWADVEALRKTASNRK
jgi:serine/threonine-protein kinase